jgi:hypothetical protein
MMKIMTRTQLFKQQLSKLMNQDTLIEATLLAGGYKTKDTYYLQKNKLIHKMKNLIKEYNNPKFNTPTIPRSSSSHDLNMWLIDRIESDS